jgi:hypothetical protein
MGNKGGRDRRTIVAKDHALGSEGFRTDLMSLFSSTAHVELVTATSDVNQVDLYSPDPSENDGLC